MTNEEKEEKEEEVFVPSQIGRVLFEGRKATQFWIRAFDLEKEIETVRLLVTEKPERKRAAVPIIAEYQVDERLKFIFVIQAQVDALGIHTGIGVVYWASPESEKEIYERRDKYANQIMQHLEKSVKFDEVIEIEMKGEE